MPVRENRRRYVFFKWRSEASLDQNAVYNAFWSNVVRLYGEAGASRINFKIIEWGEEDKFFIARCSHTNVEAIRAAAAAVREVNSKPAVFYSKGVSGTIKTLKEKFLNKHA